MRKKKKNFFHYKSVRKDGIKRLSTSNSGDARVESEMSKKKSPMVLTGFNVFFRCKQKRIHLQKKISVVDLAVSSI